MNQPSRKIIEVGVCIGSPGMPPAEFIKKNWYLDPSEPIAEFITQLTGIDDETIRNKAVSFETMASELVSLLDQHQPFINPVTWGGGDTNQLLSEIREKGIDFPYFGRRWIDVKTLHVVDKISTGTNTTGGLRSCMSQYKLTFVGEPHRADTDAYNTLRLFFEILRRRQVVNTAVAALKTI